MCRCVRINVREKIWSLARCMAAHVRANEVVPVYVCPYVHVRVYQCER